MISVIERLTIDGGQVRVIGPRGNDRFFVFLFRPLWVIFSLGRAELTADSEAAEAALFKSMMAYSGPFRIAGDDQFISEVEVSWHPGWIGTEQARTFTVDGDVLSITTAEVLHPMFPGRRGRGVLKWRRAATQAFA